MRALPESALVMRAPAELSCREGVFIVRFSTDGLQALVSEGPHDEGVVASAMPS
jgi:hypothetical protein